MERCTPGFLWRLHITRHPDVGDIAYRAEPWQHHAVVTAVGLDADDAPMIVTMNGNSGSAPGEVREIYGKPSDWTYFYSIEPVVREAVEHDKQAT